MSSSECFDANARNYENVKEKENLLEGYRVDRKAGELDMENGL